MLFGERYRKFKSHNRSNTDQYLMLPTTHGLRVWFTHLVRGSVSQHRVALEKREDALKKISLFNAFYDVGKSLL